MKQDIKKYEPEFSEGGFWRKLKRFAVQIGSKPVYAVLLLYYAYKRKDTPLWAKRVILGSLGYFVTIIDVIPDFTPFLGYTDDFGILLVGLSTIAVYVNDEVRGNAREKLEQWFEVVDENLLMEIDDRL